MSSAVPTWMTPVDVPSTVITSNAFGLKKVQRLRLIWLWYRVPCSLINAVVSISVLTFVEKNINLLRMCLHNGTDHHNRFKGCPHLKLSLKLPIKPEDCYKQGRFGCLYFVAQFAWSSSNVNFYVFAKNFRHLISNIRVLIYRMQFIGGFEGRFDIFDVVLKSLKHNQRMSLGQSKRKLLSEQL